MKKRVLLLEADKFLARNLIKLLESPGREVDWQVDPQEAVISMDDKPVDLIITDLIMAGRSGIEFLYEIRSYPDWKDLPVIVYSNVPAFEAGFSLSSFDLLGIVAYHCKTSCSSTDLLSSVETQLARVPA